MNIVEKYYYDMLEPTVTTIAQTTVVFEFDIDFIKYSAPKAINGDVYVTVKRNGRVIQSVTSTPFRNGVHFEPMLEVGDEIVIRYDAILYGRV